MIKMLSPAIFTSLLCLLVNQCSSQAPGAIIHLNSAIVPVPKLEDDSYNWLQRHRDVLNIKDSLNPEIVLIGNSITHFWGGLPLLKYNDGSLRKPNGPVSWQKLFGHYRVLNLGFGWDRTQNVLWRLDNGELDNLHPRLVIIEIGTNNTSATDHARINTAAEIAAGVSAICQRLHSIIPHARIILMAIFPREQSAAHPRRILINQTNALLRTFAKNANIIYIDKGKKWLTLKGAMLQGITSDLTHPTEKGYAIWAAAIRPYVHSLQ